MFAILVVQMALVAKNNCAGCNQGLSQHSTVMEIFLEISTASLIATFYLYGKLKLHDGKVEIA